MNVPEIIKRIFLDYSSDDDISHLSSNDWLAVFLEIYENTNIIVNPVFLDDNCFKSAGVFCSYITSLLEKEKERQC